MDVLFKDFARAHAAGSGYKLAETMSPCAPGEPGHLRDVWMSTDSRNAKHDIERSLQRALESAPERVRLPKEEVGGWTDVYVAYWKTVGEILDVEEQTRGGSWTRVYTAWKELASALYRGYSNNGFEAWTIPCLYVTGKYLRIFAIRADDERNAGSGEAQEATFQDDFDPETGRHQQLRDCEQQLKRLFTLCLSDRSPLDESRKWGIYYIINLLFKTYFKLDTATLCRTVLKALSAYKGDMPPLDSFPRSQRVTFKYFEGVLFFLEDNYVEAEKHLTEAWELCHKDAIRNKEKILTYLIPCHLLTTHTLPSAKLLEPYPKLCELFLPLAKCIRKGDLAGFDAALQNAVDEFVRRRIYLTLERGRDVAMRNLLRKVFIVGGHEETKDASGSPVRRTRVPVAEFRAAIVLASKGQQIDTDEVECILANMIYKNHMKGYIARERGIVVLSKGGAFPGTGV